MMRALVAVAALVALACGGEGSGPAAEERPRIRVAGELALPPSAGAPRVMRDAAPPDTFHPDTVNEFEITQLDSVPFAADPASAAPDPEVDRVTRSYRGHYANIVEVEGTAVRGRIDRQLQQEAERRTAQERGFPDWTAMIEALTAEQRARLVDRLNEANVELARELHGSADESEPDGTAPAGR